jgi:hypothetical protein
VSSSYMAAKLATITDVPAATWPQVVGVGQPILTTLVGPSWPLRYKVGARIEVPYTRQIVSRWREAEHDEPANTWTVTLDGVQAQGTYQLVWMTSDPKPPELRIFLPLLVGVGADGCVDGLWPAMGRNYPPVDVEDVRPTVEEVAQLERTRTFDDAGNEFSTFTRDTRPTAPEVEDIIDHSVEVVLGGLPGAFNPVFYDATRRLIARHAAMVIEGSFFKEQQQLAGPVRWEAEFTASRQDLIASIDADIRQNNLIGAMEPRQAASYARGWLA